MTLGDQTGQTLKTTGDSIAKMQCKHSLAKNSPLSRSQKGEGLAMEGVVSSFWVRVLNPLETMTNGTGFLTKILPSIYH